MQRLLLHWMWERAEPVSNAFSFDSARVHVVLAAVHVHIRVVVHVRCAARFLFCWVIVF